MSQTLKYCLFEQNPRLSAGSSQNFITKIGLTQLAVQYKTIHLQNAHTLARKENTLGLNHSSSKENFSEFLESHSKASSRHRNASKLASYWAWRPAGAQTSKPLAHTDVHTCPSSPADPSAPQNSPSSLATPTNFKHVSIVSSETLDTINS